jgi:hypothetical protein
VLALSVLDIVGEKKRTWGTYGVVSCANHTAITCDSNRCHRDIILGNQLVRAFILPEIPDPDVAAPVTADQFALVWMDDHIVHWYAVRVVALNVPRSGIPDLDCAVFRGGNKPLALAVECDAGNVTSVTVKGEDRVGVRRLDIVELDRVMTGGGKVAFIGRDTQAVDLRVWVWDGARAYSRQCLPEALGPVSVRIEVKAASGSFVPDGMVIARCDCLLAVCQGNAG